MNFYGMLITTYMENQTSLISQFMKTNPGLFSVLKPGDVVEGAVLSKNSKEIVCDLGKYGSGIVYKAEMQNAHQVVKELKVGDKIHAKVIDPDNEDGFAELSLAEAGKQKSWEQVQEIKEKDEVVPVKIVSSNRSGLIAEVAGLQAFLPVSQLSNEHYPVAAEDDRARITEALQGLVGREVNVKIIEINPKKNKLIISERDAVEENIKELVKAYKVGQTVDAIISGVADFGVFVKFADNPAIEGLVHVSELSYLLVNHPKEILNVNDIVKLKIVDINNGKVSLSLKALAENPWEKTKEMYREGQEVTGTVYSFNPFGAIISIGGLQGQLHVSEFGGIEEMKKAIELGKSYPFVIDRIQAEEKRITLKLKK